MVCREARVGSAITSYVIQSTNLEEQQVLSLYHEVMREGRDAVTPTAQQQQVAIDAIRDEVAASTSMTDARRRSILNRLEQSRTEPMNGQRYYSTSRLLARARRAEAALNDYVTATARELGCSEDEARARLNHLRDTAGRDRTRAPSSGWVGATRSSSDYAGAPLDRQTAYAMEILNHERAVRRAAQPTRPTVTRERVTSSAISEIGYDPATGRCEVVMRSNPNVPYAYRMSPEEYAEFRQSPSLGSYFATNIRGNDHYRYDAARTAAAEGAQTQCATCGQFAGAGHACPTRDSAEERNRTIRQATARARARAQGTRPTATTAEAATASATATPVEAAEPQRISGTGRSRAYYGESGGFRTVNLTEVQQHARRNRAGVSVPLNATIVAVAGEGGVADRSGGRHTLTGRVNVAYNGRGRGYTATACTSPGDSGHDQLRCSCAEYRRNYDCVHVRQTVQDVNTRLNQERLRDRHGIGEAIAQVNADLARDRAESVEAQQTSRATWGQSPVSYTADPAAFQREYTAAKQRAANGEEPVPYMTENATDGLGSRGTGRAFGVELEFDVNPGVDRARALAAIGRDLHAAGLTSTDRQMGYHSADRRGYTENHRGGWSFEADCTVAGEIVSPIMYDEPQTWENLAKVCEIVKRHGGVMTTRTGSHVHVSAHNYDHTVENHNRLIGMFHENEDTIYRLSANPERGTHRGPQWCAPNRRAANGYSSVREANRMNSSHGLGINMQSVHGRDSDHVEFRTYDGSMNPSVIQTQIKMSLAMTEAAFRDRDYTPGSQTMIGSHRSHNRAEHGASRRLTGEAWRQDTAGFRSFADRLFRRPEDKAQLTSLFAVTKWQAGTHR